jgi:hypothetical protein
MKRLFLTTAIFWIALLCGSRAPAGLRRAEAASDYAKALRRDGESAAQAGNRHVVIAGYIGDSMCGLRHGRSVHSPAEERDCTLQCVTDGSKFILADRAARKVYQLEDQDAPRPFAGKKVRVTGEIDGQSVRVETIQPAE